MRLCVALVLIGLLSCSQKKSSPEEKIEMLPRATERDSTPVASSQQCTYYNKVSDLGIGVAKIERSFELFNDSLLTESYISIKDLYKDEDKINFCPLFFLPDYGILQFACLEETKSYFKVAIGTSDIKYLPKTASITFQSWSDYIMGSFGIRRGTTDGTELSAEQDVRESASDQAKSVPLPAGYELFCPMEINGDWVKVTWDCFYNLEDNVHEGEPCSSYISECTQPITGWITWRKGNELLIDILLMP